MGHKVKQSLMSSRIDFFYYAFRNALLVSVPLLVVCVLVLGLSVSRSSAAELSQADNLAISIPSSCTLSSLINGEHSKSILNGTYESGIGQSIITTYCNDRNGYVVYAIGSSNNELGNNKLISNINDNTNNYDIASGIATSGTTSNWAMKLSTSDIDSSIINTNVGDDTPTIEPEYKDQYAIVPTTWTKVLSKPSGTVASATGSSFTTTYATYVSTTQPAGTYLGQVRYLLAHPATNPKVLYMQDVAEWKDKLNTHDTVLAIDKRDYKAYWVTKLLDGHIWMTQNLAIDLGEIDIVGNVTPRIFTSEDTDLNTIYDEATGNYAEYNDGYSYNSTSDIISWTPANSAATTKFEGDNAGNYWRSSFTEPYSAVKTDGPSTGHESLGNYYNWTAAIASNDSSSLATSTYTNASNNPQNSICPKGWRLPTISNQSNTTPGSTNEFARLNYIYNDNKSSGEDAGTNLITRPLWFVQTGYINISNDSLRGYDVDGKYWSSTVSGGHEVYYLSFSNNNINAGGAEYFNRRQGSSLRCLAR